jgi:hypothetical protein
VGKGVCEYNLIQRSSVLEAGLLWLAKRDSYDENNIVWHLRAWKQPKHLGSFHTAGYRKTSAVINSAAKASLKSRRICFARTEQKNSSNKMKRYSCRIGVPERIKPFFHGRKKTSGELTARSSSRAAKFSFIEAE